jgi:hypothetical protein
MPRVDLCSKATGIPRGGVRTAPAPVGLITNTFRPVHTTAPDAERLRSARQNRPAIRIGVVGARLRASSITRCPVQSADSGTPASLP